MMTQPFLKYVLVVFQNLSFDINGTENNAMLYISRSGFFFNKYTYCDVIGLLSIENDQMK